MGAVTTGVKAEGSNVGDEDEPVDKAWAQSQIGGRAVMVAGSGQSPAGRGSPQSATPTRRAGHAPGDRSVENPHRRPPGVGPHPATPRPTPQAPDRIILTPFPIRHRDVYRCGRSPAGAGLFMSRRFSCLPSRIWASMDVRRHSRRRCRQDTAETTDHQRLTERVTDYRSDKNQSPIRLFE